MHACVRVSAFAPSQRRQQQQNNNTPNQQQQHPIRSDPIVVVCYCVCFWKRFQTIDSKMASSGAAEKEKFHNGSFKAYPHSELNNSTDDVGRAKDPVGYMLATEQRARERQVAYETVRLLREDVIECYRREGVNHYDNCQVEVQRFYDVIKKKDMGQLHPKWKNPSKLDGW